MFGTMPNRQVARVSVARLNMQATGGYNTIYQRPYQTHVDGATADAITRRVDEFGSGRITGTLLAGVAGNIVTPSPTPQGEIYIPNGWAESRIRFILEVHCEYAIGSTVIYYFQGYTTYMGVSQNGHVAPDMEFIINSFVGVTRTNQLTPMGIQTRDVVCESSHVLSDPTWQSPLQGNSHYMLRPQDIFTGMQSAYLQGGFGMSNEASYLDGRSMLRREATRSTRANSLPTNYVARVIDGYCAGKELTQFGQNEKDVLGLSRQQVFETPLSENPFIRTISDMKQVGIVNRFTYGELERLDPNTRANTNLTILGATQLTRVHAAGQTAYWNGSDRDTVVATILSHAVPALMMELMINKITFRSTNHDITGMMNTVIIDAKSLTNADLTKHFEIFKMRLEREVMLDITFNNQEAYMLDMTVDLFGETWITLSLAGAPAVQYVTPSYCDNLFVPVVTGNRGQYDNVVHDFETLVNGVSDSIGTKLSPATINNIV